MSVVIHRNSFFSMPCGFTMARKSKKTEQESTKPEAELALLRKKMSALSSTMSREALSGSARPGDRSSHPPRPAHQQVESDTESNEFLDRGAILRWESSRLRLSENGYGELRRHTLWVACVCADNCFNKSVLCSYFIFLLHVFSV